MRLGQEQAAGYVADTEAEGNVTEVAAPDLSAAAPAAEPSLAAG